MRPRIERPRPAREASRLRRAALPGACALLLLLACAPPERVQPDVLLVTIDTLRADHLGAYGSGRGASPAIDGFAAQAVVFERAIAAASRTVPAHASIMTSRNTREHSVGHRNGETTLRGVPTLAEAFAGAGYRTGGFVGNILLTSGTGIGTGFETFDDDLETPELNRPHVVERLADDTTDRATGWLDAPDARPTFLWVHYQDPHGPYTPPREDLAPFERLVRDDEAPLPVGTENQGRGVIPPYQALPGVARPSAYAARYAGEIHFADRAFARLLARAEARAAPRPLVVLLTADHGESLGEAGFHFMHTHATTPDVAHVPLIVRAPGLAPGRIDGAVGHVDVMPTLLELAGLAAPAGLRGLALGPVARGEAELPRRFVYCDIGSQLSAYDDAGFVLVGRAAMPWQRPGRDDPRVAQLPAQRFGWTPGSDWRPVGSRAPAPEPVVAYARRATAMQPLTRPDAELQDRLRALGYAD